MDDADQEDFPAPDDPAWVAPDDPRYAFLRAWLEKNENRRELTTGLRYLGGRVADVRRIDAKTATRDLLTEVILIALTQAYPKYDLAYRSPCLWLKRIANFITLRWKSEAAKEAWRYRSLTDYLEQDNASSLAEIVSRIDALHGADHAGSVIDRIVADAALSRLSAGDRQIVELNAMEELSFAEIGERLGINEGTARVRHHRALKKLQAYSADDDLQDPILAVARSKDARSGGAESYANDYE